MSIRTITPAALKKGDMIGVMAPSTRAEQTKLDMAVAFFEKAGFSCFIHPQSTRRQKSSVETAKEKTAAFHDLIADKKIRAVIAARGGNLCGTMLPHVDFKLVARNPKIIMGYSDTTALLNAVTAKTGIATFHGPTMHTVASGLPKKQMEQCLNLLTGGKELFSWSKGGSRNGKATGRLIGGNLSLLSSLMGTPWQPDFTNAIVFLEDCADERSRIHRMLIQLNNAGIFNQAAGIVFGGFSGLKDTGHTRYIYMFRDMVQEIRDATEVPIATLAPFGHGKDLFTLPVGAPARLSVRGEGTKLELESPAVAL